MGGSQSAAAPPGAVKDLPRMEGRGHPNMSPKCLRMMYSGAVGVYSSLFSGSGAHIWIDVAFPVLLTVPFAFFESWVVQQLKWDFGKETWTFISAAVAFLVTGKMSLAYGRYWEARGHLGAAIAGCRSIAILIKPTLLKAGVGRKYGKKYGLTDEEVKEIVSDLRRYMLLYYWTLILQLLDISPRTKIVMELLEGRPEEEELLFARKQNMALTALTWVSARISHLEVGAVLSPLELQEAQEHIHDLVGAFNGTTKIKSTPMPAPMGHLCAFLVNFYVYTTPLALATNFKSIPDVGFYGISGRVVFSGFMLGCGFFGIYNLGNTFEDPFGDQENDMGGMMVTMGNGLTGDLKHILGEKGLEVPPLLSEKVIQPAITAAQKTEAMAPSQISVAVNK
jgi:predicted membrane chloride channel (bestrophin family)